MTVLDTLNNCVIRLKNISKYFVVGDSVVKALNNVSFSILKNDYIAIMGPSGSGKSTLMNLIGCLDTPSEGQIFIENEDISNLSESELAYVRNKKIGFVFQQFNLLPKLNALENVMTPLIYSNDISVFERRELAEESLIKVGLKDRMKHKPTELSGGQKQRVAIARALVTDPSLVLADEPTGALDSKTGLQIMDMFTQLNEEGRTIVVVTHSDDVGMSCNEIIRIRDGQIEIHK